MAEYEFLPVTTTTTTTNHDHLDYDEDEEEGDDDTYYCAPTFTSTTTTTTTTTTTSTTAAITQAAVVAEAKQERYISHIMIIDDHRCKYPQCLEPWCTDAMCILGAPHSWRRFAADQGIFQTVHESLVTSVRM